MILFQVPEAVAAQYKIRIQSGVTVAQMPAEKFGGENKKVSFLYLLILWLVSVWAIITNLSQVFFRKLFVKEYRNISLGKALWKMGRDPNHISSTFVDRFSQFNHVAKYGAAGWRSLDVFYNCQEKVLTACQDALSRHLTKYWIGRMENRQAVTNRLKIVTELLALALRRFLNEPEIRILSVASGSAQAVIEAIKKSPGLDIRVALIDADITAIDEAKRLVAEAGLQDCFQFFHGSTTLLEEVCKDFHPHIVEMVGFLDYRSDKKATELISRIRNILPAGGIFLTCNIRKNSEKIFLDWVLLWPMIYRNEKQFSNLLLSGGFTPESIDIIYEPLWIHGVGVCRK